MLRKGFAASANAGRSEKSLDQSNQTPMTAKDLIAKLSQVDPDTEVIGGTWNGRTNTYTVLDELHVFY